MMRCCVQCYHTSEDDPNDGLLATYSKLYYVLKLFFFSIVVSVLEAEFGVYQGLLMVGLPSSTLCSLACSPACEAANGGGRNPPSAQQPR